MCIECVSSNKLFIFFSFSGKTRTKDKYRVVYTDHQRVELEKEFYYSRYITIRRKAELASNLGLSERQVKIWFQNRRAKERKQVKKRDELNHKESEATLQHIQQQPTQPPMLHQQSQQQMGRNIVSVPVQLMWQGDEVGTYYSEWNSFWTAEDSCVLCFVFKKCFNRRAIIMRDQVKCRCLW